MGGYLNGAWGYMLFPNVLNAVPGDGFYYVHGRWYIADIGQWMSPNEKGDYWYGGDGQDPVNVASFSNGQAQNDPKGRYIYTNGGEYIDADHFNISGALDVIQQVKLGKGVRIPSSGQNLLCPAPCDRIPGLVGISVDYSLNPPIMDNYGVALAIWEDFQTRFETAQPSDTFGVAGGISNFALEDLPTDYLSFWAAAKADAEGRTTVSSAQRQSYLNEIISSLGGLKERSDRETPHCSVFIINCPYTNKSFTPKVEQREVLHYTLGICPVCIDIPHENVSYVNIPWPVDLTLVGGKPLVPINDGSWKVKSCELGFVTHHEACN